MELKYVLIPAHHISELLFFMGHHRVQQVLSIFASEKQCFFYNYVFTNLKYTNIDCASFKDFTHGQQNLEGQDQLVNKVDIAGKVCVLMDVPTKFEQMEKILSLLEEKNAKQIVLVLLQHNRKYINMMKKKVKPGKINFTQTQYSVNMLIGINKKLRQLVDKSYQLNRAAFYAYGAYINNYKANLLKFIFKTQDLDVAALAKSFGFTTPQRVKQGKFIKPEVRKKQLRAKLYQKRRIKKQKLNKQTNQQEDKVISSKKLTSDEKIKALAAKKTKLILKQKAKKIQKTQKIPSKAKKSQETNKQQIENTQNVRTENKQNKKIVG